ncbi:uncharacterized protein METZ01_LOCUS83687, partial [marine metagenome]
FYRDRRVSRRGGRPGREHRRGTGL